MEGGCGAVKFIFRQWLHFARIADRSVLLSVLFLRGSTLLRRWLNWGMPREAPVQCLYFDSTLDDISLAQGEAGGTGYGRHQANQRHR
jgi:hypothetical protein